jgi:hypothetical protein
MPESNFTERPAAPEAIGVWITLTKGFVALVDREDEHLAAFKWTACVRRRKNGGVRVYAVREWVEDGKPIRQLLHHAVRPRSDVDTDHHDGDTLNNRRSNLRDATRTQNNANAVKRGGIYGSRFKGVYRCGKRWTAQVRNKHIGCFRSEVNAATAYNFAAYELFGEFSRGNLP